MVPSWVKHAIWWQVYPLGFTGAPVRTEHDRENRFPHLEAWLDYAVELGASGVLLGPIFASSTHGYDTVDFFSIDPRLGTDKDFDHFLGECSKRGLRVVLDGVFNHVGAEHPWVRDVKERGAGSPYAAFLEWEEGPEGPDFGVFEGHESLVNLRHKSSQTRSEVERVMKYWLARGVDGWRLDAAYAVPPSFWAEVLPRVRGDFPEAWFVGEVIHGDYGEIASQSTLDSLTQYELWKAIWSSLVDRNYYELAASLERNNSFLEEELPLTFIGNHDVTRIASLVGTGGAALALTTLLTVGGIPSLYYGDEHGYMGEKKERVGGDDDVRPLFPPNPAELGTLGADTYRLYQELIALRRRNSWLSTSRTTLVDIDNETIEYDSVSTSGNDSLRVSLSLRGGYTARVTDTDGNVVFRYSAEG